MKTQIIKNNLLLNSLINSCPFTVPSEKCILKPYRNAGNKNFIQFTKSEIAQIMISHNNCVDKRNLEIKFNIQPDGIELLTKREKTVVELLLKGFNDNGIADELFISQNTAHNHHKNIYRKLKITKAIELFKKFQ
ncbi:MAG: hypothetical protein A2046_12890 [Bacteroidetes bacterium GWA2_30_7]|nr:MAG: hypothetical protein A2046_12890 [Bacteroidetes bacterium GWA2_30_7]